MRRSGSTRRARRAALVDRQLLQCFDYLLANNDRHTANGLYDATSGVLSFIDSGHAGRGQLASNGGSVLVPALRKLQAGSKGGHVDLDPAVVDYLRRRTSADRLRAIHAATFDRAGVAGPAPRTYGERFLPTHARRRIATASSRATNTCSIVVATTTRRTRATQPVICPRWTAPIPTRVGFDRCVRRLRESAADAAGSTDSELPGLRAGHVVADCPPAELDDAALGACFDAPLRVLRDEAGTPVATAVVRDRAGVSPVAPRG